MNEYSTITGVSEEIKAGRLLPSDLVKVCLDRIQKLNPKLNAFITVLHDQALEHARVAGEEIKMGQWKGPLHGIPIAFKDFFDTKGILTTAAFIHFKNRTPTKDAVAVQKLKQAGAIIIGKTNMHTLGMGTTSADSYFGPVHNPWNAAYVAGGSSGGSAAAVASGLCFAAIDTDAVGSCRLPASCCGVTGFKATYGLISGQGILEGEPVEDSILKLSHVGITTRSANDTALLLNILAERTVSDEVDYSPIQNRHPNYKIGIASNYQASKGVERSFRALIDSLKDGGSSLSDVHVPFEAASFSNMSRIGRDRKTISVELFENIDVLLLPTTADEIPTIESAIKSGPQAVSATNTFFANYFGLPAISIPCGFDENHLPVGVQIVGPAWKERQVLEVAAMFERLGFGYSEPPINPQWSSLTVLTISRSQSLMT